MRPHPHRRHVPESGSRRTPKRQSPALIKSLFPRDKPASATPTSPYTTANQAYADAAVAAPVPPSRPHQRYSAIRGVLCLPRAPMDLGGGGAAPHLPFSSASSPLLRSRDSPTARLQPFEGAQLVEHSRNIWVGLLAGKEGSSQKKRRRKNKKERKAAESRR